MHYDGFTPDFIVMGKATGLAMVLANKESWACKKLPTRSVTTAPAERLLRCVHLMESIFSDQTSPYINIAAQIPEYHTSIRDAISRCMAAEEARQQAWQNAPPGGLVHKLEVDEDVWRRFRDAPESCGDRVPAFWGGNMLWFSVAGPRAGRPERGPGNTALGYLVQSGLGMTSNFLRAIFTFRSTPTHLKSWLEGGVWVYPTAAVKKPASPPAARQTKRRRSPSS
jgi:hypothetical protein